MDESADNANQAAGGRLSGLARRDKYWDECDVGQQIERLREQVIRQQRLIEAAEMFIDELMMHSHGADGALLVPIKQPATERRFPRIEYTIPYRLQTAKERG